MPLSTQGFQLGRTALVLSRLPPPCFHKNVTPLPFVSFTGFLEPHKSLRGGRTMTHGTLMESSGTYISLATLLHPQGQLPSWVHEFRFLPSGWGPHTDCESDVDCYPKSEKLSFHLYCNKTPIDFNKIEKSLCGCTAWGPAHRYPTGCIFSTLWTS